MGELRVRRIYEEPSSEDGTRVLVDRLWPRGVSKERAKLDLWLKDIGPSDELRKWYGHVPERWPEFQVRYRKELESKQEEVKTLKDLLEKGTVTILFAARDEERNEAWVIHDFITGKS